jgi:carbon-monoxide dehydrogenase medium subunit
VGSVNVRPVLVPAAEEILRGSEVEAVDPAAVGEAASSEVEPVADLNGSVDYKRQLVRVLTARTLTEVL